MTQAPTNRPWFKKQPKRAGVPTQDLEDLDHDVIIRVAEKIDQLRKLAAFPGWIRAIEKDLSRKYQPTYIQPSKQVRRQKELPPRPKQIGTKWITVDGQRHPVRVFEPAPPLEEPQRQLRFVELSDSTILKASRSNRPNYPRSIDVRQALARLPRRWALAIHLVYFVGYSRTEAAKIMGCSRARIFKLLQKAKNRLRALLPGYARNANATLRDLGDK